MQYDFMKSDQLECMMQVFCADIVAVYIGCSVSVGEISRGDKWHMLYGVT